MSDTAYVLLARKRALLNALNRTADNIANASTAGYKPERDLFKAQLVRPSGTGRGAEQDFPIIDRTQRMFDQGLLKTTERALDFSIQGEGFFTVQTPLGPRYTRAGDFALNAQGTLVTKEGYTVLAQGGGDITFAPDDGPVTVRDNGALEAGGQARGTLAVAAFENPQLLTRTGTGYYRAPENAAPARSIYRVLQGTLEDSSVNTIDETVRLTATSRELESVKKLESSNHDTLLNAIRKLGDVR